MKSEFRRTVSMSAYSAFGMVLIHSLSWYTSKHKTFSTRPETFIAHFFPIRPVPITPQVLFSNNKHCMLVISKSAFLVITYDMCVFFAKAIIWVTAYSAMDPGEYDGTLAALMPAALSSSVGELSKPAEQ